MAFMHLEKSFDSIHSRASPEASTNQGMEKQYKHTLANIHKETMAKVKIYDDPTTFPTCKGVGYL